MFDFALPACLAGVLAMLYLWQIAPRILPHRNLMLSDTSPRVFDARLQLGEESPVLGKTLAEAIALCGGDMRVVRVRAPERLYHAPARRRAAGRRSAPRAGHADQPQALRRRAEGNALLGRHHRRRRASPVRRQPDAGRDRGGRRLRAGPYQPALRAFPRSLPAGGTGAAPRRQGRVARERRDPGRDPRARRHSARAGRERSAGAHEAGNRLSRARRHGRPAENQQGDARARDPRRRGGVPRRWASCRSRSAPPWAVRCCSSPAV